MADLTPPPANDHSGDIAIHPKEKGAKRRKLRNLLLKLSLLLTIIGPLIFVAAAIGAKLGVWSWQFGLGVLTRQVGPLVLMIAAAVAILALLSAFLVKPRKGLIIAIVGLLVPALAFGKLGQTTKTLAELPFIHDVSTDTQDPPVFGSVVMAERNALEGVNTADYIGKKAPITKEDGTRGEALVSALQTQAYPEIRPLVLDSPKDIVFGEVLATAKSMGWNIKEQDPVTGRIDATDTTFWYGFKDDVTIRLRDASGGGTVVDVRSLSRVGGSDIGKNAARIGDFLERLGE